MKKKRKKNGFTLIELLGVIVILLAISAIAIPSITAGVERTKETANNAKKQVLESYGEIYYEEHKSSYGSKNNFCITIQDLIEDNYATADEGKDADGNNLNGSIKYKEGKFKYSEESC